MPGAGQRRSNAAEARRNAELDRFVANPAFVTDEELQARRERISSARTRDDQSMLDYQTNAPTVEQQSSMEGGAPEMVPAAAPDVDWNYQAYDRAAGAYDALASARDAFNAAKTPDEQRAAAENYLRAKSEVATAGWDLQHGRPASHSAKFMNEGVGDVASVVVPAIIQGAWSSGGPITGALGGMIGQAVRQGPGDSMNSDDYMRSGGRGLVSGALSGLGNYGSAVSDNPVVGNAITGAGNSAATTAITGGNSEEIGQSAIAGGVGGALNAAQSTTSNAGPTQPTVSTGNTLADNVLKNATAAATTASLTGGDAGQAATNAATGALVGSAANALGTDNQAVNQGIATTLGGLASGQSLEEASTSGLVSGTGSALGSQVGPVFAPAARALVNTTQTGLPSRTSGFNVQSLNPQQRQQLAQAIARRRSQGA